LIDQGELIVRDKRTRRRGDPDRQQVEPGLEGKDGNDHAKADLRETGSPAS
jgi:hypothetical protein